MIAVGLASALMLMNIWLEKMAAKYLHLRTHLKLSVNLTEKHW